MSGKKQKSWLLAKPDTSIKFNNTVIEESVLHKLINEVVLDTIAPHGAAEYKHNQYKKLEKYNHLLDILNRNIANLTETVKSDLANGYLRASDASFIVDDYFERLMDSVSYAGSAIKASIGKENEESY